MTAEQAADGPRSDAERLAGPNLAGAIAREFHDACAQLDPRRFRGWDQLSNEDHMLMTAAFVDLLKRGIIIGEVIGKDERKTVTVKPRYGPQTRASIVCEDCGGLVADQAAHNRFHSIMSAWAWALAILKTHHASAGVHDRYDIIERIDSRRFDNWSADALAEMVAEHLREPD